MSIQWTTLLLFALVIAIDVSKSLAQFPPTGLEPDPQKLKQAQALEAKAVTTHDSVLLGKSYFLFAEAFHIGGQHATAKDYYLKTIQILSSKGDFYELGKAYLRLNEGLTIKIDSREDIENAKKALGIFNRIHSLSGMALAYNYLTTSYKRSWLWPIEGINHINQINQFKSDLAKQDTLRSCIHNIERYGLLANDTTMIAEANLQQADLLRHLKQHAAFGYFDIALHLFRRQKNYVSVVHTLCHMAATHAEFRQYRKAKNLLDQAQALTETKALTEYLMLTHLSEAKTEYYEQIKEWKIAYMSLRVLAGLYIYRSAGERDVVVSSINAQLKTETKEALLRAQASEIKSLKVQKELSVALLALLVMAIGMSFTFFQLYRKNRRISRQNQELVKEQNHRVKNNLQAVSSMLSLQADQLSDQAARQAVEESHLRVQSMAILHHKLYDGDQLAKVDLEVFIPELISGVLQTFKVMDLATYYQVDPIYLSADKATPLGLILNELVTNACKYAFPSHSSPELRVSCRQINRTIHLEVADNGPGFSYDQNTSIPLSDLLRRQSKTFGIPLIQSQVIQLKAVARFESENQAGSKRGTTFFLDFTI